MTWALAVQTLASIITLASMWGYGNRHSLGPVLAVVGQVFWWIIMFQGSLWGLLPLNIAMVFVHTRNLLKWRREATIKWRRDARREAGARQAQDQRADAVQGNHPQRRAAKAYSIIAGGELR